MPTFTQPLRHITSSANYKWWAYGAIATGLFLTVMDQSGVNLAVPRIADSFILDIPTAQWIVLGYILSTSAFLLPMGRVSDIVGREKVYIIGLLGFMVLAALGGMAQSFYVLIISKVLQGIAAAAIQANAMAMVIDVFPKKERGKALGLYMTIIGTGSITGPIVGGLLVSSFGWRAVFFAGIPVGLLAVLAAVLILGRDSLLNDIDSRWISFDWIGAFLSSGALIIFLLTMTNAYKIGWASPFIGAGIITTLILAAAFIHWERHVKEPMLDMGLFSNILVSFGVGARFISFLASSSVFFLMPFYLIHIVDYSARDAGLILVPGSILMATMGPISGRWSDRIGTRWLSVIGMGVSTIAMLVFSRLEVGSSGFHVVIGMVLSGTGMGMFSSTNTSAITSVIGRERYGIASALMSVTRTSGNVTGIAVATTIVSYMMASMGFEPSLSAAPGEGTPGLEEAFVSGLHRAYLMASGFAFMAMVLSIARGESKE